ncbi:MAG: GH116 family glycosyl hydrolase [Bacteroidales bacterium]
MKDEKCSCGGSCNPGIDRRDFLRLTGVGSLGLFAGLPVMAGPFKNTDFQDLVPVDKKLSPEWVKSLFERGVPQVYKGEELKYIGMPVGGICTGQMYLGGDGKLWQWDIFNKRMSTGDAHYAHPVEANSSVEQGFAITIKSKGATETFKLDKTRFPEVTFRGEYPIGIVDYHTGRRVETDNNLSLPAVTLEAFSPFIPLSVDESSLPATIMRFTLKNNSDEPVEATLFGWLENAVCRTSAGSDGMRKNTIIHKKDYSFLNCSVEKLTGPKPSKRPDIPFEDWHEDTYAGWTVEGNAFGTGPVKKSDIPGYQGDVGGDTGRVVNSHASAATAAEVGSRDTATGILTSKFFNIERKYINVWIGGGNHKDKTCFNVLVDGNVVRSVTGMNDNKMSLQSLNVSDLAGKEACIKIIDTETGGWGNIGVGRITFSDEPARTEEMEKMPDYGTMGLALLGESANYAVAETENSGLGGNQRVNASARLEDTLIGAIGRMITIQAGESAILTFALTWNFPNLVKPGKGRYYASKFVNARATAAYLAKNHIRLYNQTKLWRDTWYDSTLPYWFLDRTFANASTLATSTAFRFYDGKFWGWEGVGCCEGTCTHVWHYEQTMGRIFPELDIVLREKTDFNPQDSFRGDGVVEYRGKGSGAAIDGQAGIILRSLRDHQMSPDNAFLKRNWPKIKNALEWMIAQDGTENGIIKTNQHNTLDAEWFGEVAWLSGLYLAALKAGKVMAEEMADLDFAAKCNRILESGRINFVGRMWNGEYFIQVGDPAKANTVGSYDGCEIDQVLGQGWAWQVGLGEVLPREQTRKALKSLWKYNFTPDVGPFREDHKPGRWYAMAGEAGTLMCSWPKGESKRVTTNYDFYFNECMNGFEHQLSGHMIWENMLLEGFAIERAIHDRYHALRRNPWNEVECGDHYARSMASYGVFLAACGFEYHGPKGHLGFAPRLTPENFKAPFTTAEGWGTFEQKAQGARLKAQVRIKYGRLKVKSLSLAVTGEMDPAAIRFALNGKVIEGQLSVNQGKGLITLKDAAVIEEGGELTVEC